MSAHGEIRPPSRRRSTPAVYRRRRLVVLALVIALIVAIVLGARGGGGGESLSVRDVVRAQREAQPVRFTIEASGDLLIHSLVWERALALGGGTYDFAPLFDAIEPYVAGADLALCHVETPMTPAPPASYPIFNTPPELARGIKATGFDACTTASNHSLDQAQTGIEETGKALDRVGVEHTGSFPSPVAQRKPVIVDVHGVQIALLAYTTDTNGIPAPHPWSVNIASRERVLADARRAQRKGAEAVIVNLHWGGEIVPEYQSQPSSGQLDLVSKLTASGPITAIVGQGPHAVQPIERINDKFVVFSEGNLVSNQSPEAGLPASSQEGLIALLDCVAKSGEVEVRGVRYVPVFVNHPDYEVLPVGDALKGGQGDPTLLRDSYQRTVSVVGRGKRIEPVPSRLPGG
jgi:poly-gamma-glutamate capsule biosynthesis protein CapA/YwtB (metallophosphatase superfamily)